MDTVKTPMYDARGSVIGVLGIARDITEHRQLEAQYLQAQKMESIGTLAGGIAHDFNNILSAIIGYGHVALMKMAEDDPQRHNIESMLEGADRAAYLTKSLLLFSRKQITERKPVELNEVVRKVEKFLRRVIGEDIECKTVLSETPLAILADSYQLEQVLMNLATNARDAMRAGGVFTILTEQVNLDEDFTVAHGYGKPGVYALMTLSDAGMGMDENTRKRIFEPFFTTKEVGKGTGLGLAVVYGIIKQHDGFINVYSEPGKGTTFRIYLPLVAPESIEEAKTYEEEAPSRGTETVLLAEDDEDLRKLSRTVLTDHGYTVIEAVDGEEAVKKFMENKDRVQLLLFDLIMPKMNGKEACDEIRRIKPDIKVIFSSGYAPDMLDQKTLLGEGAAMILKPVSPKAILRKVRSVLDGAAQS
jgi:nitrogen-specific signal transduction histidine kinase